MNTEMIKQGFYSGAGFGYMLGFLTGLLNGLSFNEALALGGQSLFSGALGGGASFMIYYLFFHNDFVKCFLSPIVGVLIFSLGNSLIIQYSGVLADNLMVEKNFIESIKAGFFGGAGAGVVLYTFEKIKKRKEKIALHKK